MQNFLGLSHNATLLLWTLLVIVFLVMLIARYKWNPFVTLLLSALVLGLLAGMEYQTLIKSVTGGLGGTLGTIAIVIGLGTMLGKMMAESGGAERIANTLVDRFGEKNVHWAMMLVGFVVGIPVFFEVGVILLIPVVFMVARKTKMPLLQIGIPILAGLSTVHGLVPPHPAPMIAIDAYGANLGKTIMYSILVGLPTAIIAGPLFGKFIGKRIEVTPPAELAEQFAAKSVRELPGFGITLLTILLPVILMLTGSVADILDPSGVHAFTPFAKFIGHEVIALLIAAVFSFFSLGFARGFKKEDISRFTSECLAPTASIILIIGGGGAFKQVLIDSGVGGAIAAVATQSHVNIIFFAWLVAALIRVATGSATVAMTTAAGIVAPVLAVSTGVNIELVVLATGAGSLVLSHVNDAGFWMIKEFFGMSVVQTLKTWTVMETLLSVVGLVFIIILSVFV
ncbi:gluconate:H+ symporter [Paenibacillus sp. NFR01]|uniref:GntT/GntP/DsdX family permease n=1 Tax=Paenibacillus sp. NFR01 TaxID=1566279 RepID=UPI0008C3150B|nr:gluconate:H+ symporter [Paenibacillus sp. NFR01]SEU22500.1 gluconate:H+ symporter, GntP family [Paenibacillus sp. NFR01]